MDRIKLRQDIGEYIKKYRFAVLILILGVGMMLLPEKVEKQPPAPESPEVFQTDKTVCQELQHILTQIKGAGRVELMLTVAAGETTKFQTDIKITDGESGSQQQNTVIITDSKRGQSGLIAQKIPPVYQGAIVVCQGADQPSVRLAVTDAVAKATGLDSSKISVVKMK